MVAEKETAGSPSILCPSLGELKWRKPVNVLMTVL